MREITRSYFRFKYQNLQDFFWSDSIYSLTLINSISTKLSTFEFNRVTKIGIIGSEFIWLHIPGIFNPSDVTSRGEYPKRYKEKYGWIYQGLKNLKQRDPLLINPAIMDRNPATQKDNKSKYNDTATNMTKLSNNIMSGQIHYTVYFWK